MRTFLPLPALRSLAADARRIARRLELRSFPLLQEQFSAQEGLRAGVICVTDMLQPGAGIASARALDNLIGSGAALLAALALWPDLGASPRQRIAAALQANRAYLDAVLQRQPAPVLRQLQRQAGLASIDAETALHELGGLRRQRDGLTEEEVASLRSLRELAGQASVQWHRQHADGKFS
ncbi:hypothetical protein HBDW_10420 [Herbaspirillum sp. DW155]|uniref:hypothetical protein n=1 Tax=Herbaspirillum sp. DW155 TaxID=3095609 RepID=UPI00308A7F9B|nr:hypothetical protein HBDW_10420 [Herbaspirillum sp. DW155]